MSEPLDIRYTSNSSWRQKTCDTLTQDDINFLSATSPTDQAVKMLQFCRAINVLHCDLTDLFIDPFAANHDNIQTSDHHQHKITDHDINIKPYGYDLLARLLGNADCHYEAVYYIQSCWAFLVAILSLVANGIIIYTISRHRKLRTSTNCLLLSLTASDFMLALCSLYTSIMTFLTLEAGHQYNIGWMERILLKRNNYFLCLVLDCPGILFSCMMISLLSMMAIAIEKYIGVYYPLRAYRLLTHRRLVVVILTIWLPSLLFGLLPVLGWNRFRGLCYFVETTSYSYLLTWGILCSVAAIVTLLIYIQIFRVARKHARQINQTLCYVIDPTLLNENKLDQNFGSKITGYIIQKVIAKPKYDLSAERNKWFKRGPIRNDSITQKEEEDLSLRTDTCNLKTVLESSDEETTNKPKTHTRRNSIDALKETVQVLKTKMHSAVQAPSMKALKTILILLSGFYICWVPLLAYLLACNYQYQNQILYPLATLALTNSLVNPIVYGLTNKQLRAAIFSEDGK